MLIGFPLRVSTICQLLAASDPKQSVLLPIQISEQKGVVLQHKNYVRADLYGTELSTGRIGSGPVLYSDTMSLIVLCSGDVFWDYVETLGVPGTPSGSRLLLRVCLVGLRGDEQRIADVDGQRHAQRLVSSTFLRRLQPHVNPSHLKPALRLRVGRHCPQERLRPGPSQPVPADHWRLHAAGSVVR